MRTVLKDTVGPPGDPPEGLPGGPPGGGGGPPMGGGGNQNVGPLLQVSP